MHACMYSCPTCPWFAAGVHCRSSKRHLLVRRLLAVTIDVCHANVYQYTLLQSLFAGVREMVIYLWLAYKTFSSAPAQRLPAYWRSRYRFVRTCVLIFCLCILHVPQCRALRFTVAKISLMCGCLGGWPVILQAMSQDWGLETSHLAQS